MPFGGETEAKKADISDDNSSIIPLPRMINSDVSQFDDVDLVIQRQCDEQAKFLQG